MSWQTYIDNQLLGTGKVHQAAIIGHDCKTWATSPNFQVSTTEAQSLLKAFQDPTEIREQGLHVNGTKYFALNADGRSIYGKKGSTGVITVKTNQTVLIATYGETTQPGEATKVVEGLADYLLSYHY